MSEKTIYKLNNDAYFRICDFEDCTEKQSHWLEHMKKCDNFGMQYCNHAGDIHFHCAVHKEIELAIGGGGTRGPKDYRMVCTICSADPVYSPPQTINHMTTTDISSLKHQARALANSETFKNAKLVRLDDYYIPELSVKDISTKNSRYWMSYDVKQTKGGKTLLILYLGDRIDKNKVQFFIEPESNKLSHDHKDTSPIEVISRIEVEFKNGIIELKDKE